MKSVKVVALGLLALNLVIAPCLLGAEGSKTEKPKKPYPLKTCIVSGDKLGGDMGAPYIFTYQDREIKLCCKGCLKDFEKDAAKYIKKLEEAEKKADKKDKKV